MLPREGALDDDDTDDDDVGDDDLDEDSYHEPQQNGGINLP